MSRPWDDDIVGIVSRAIVADEAPSGARWYMEEPQTAGFFDVNLDREPWRATSMRSVELLKDPKARAQAEAAVAARELARKEAVAGSKAAAGRILGLAPDSPERRRIDAIRVTIEEE